MRTIFELFSKLAELQLVLPRKSLLKILLDSASLPKREGSLEIVSCQAFWNQVFR